MFRYQDQDGGVEKEKVPNGRYTKEFRKEAVKMVMEGGLSVLEVSSRLSLPKSTLERWRRVSKTGNLCEIGESQRPLTEIERELAQVKRELSLAKMEQDILKKVAAYFVKESLRGAR
jgi:transposase